MNKICYSVLPVLEYVASLMRKGSRQKRERRSMVNRSMKRAAIFIAIAGVLIGLTASLFAVHEIMGIWGVILGILIFPLTFAYLPFYVLFAEGNWSLILLNYGSIAVSWILLHLADQKEKKPQEPRAAIDEPPTQPVATKDNPTVAIILAAIGGLVLAAYICARVS